MCLQKGQASGGLQLCRQGTRASWPGLIGAEVSLKHVRKVEEIQVPKYACQKALFLGKPQKLANSFQTAAAYGAAPENLLALH